LAKSTQLKLNNGAVEPGQIVTPERLAPLVALAVEVPITMASVFVEIHTIETILHGTEEVVKGTAVPPVETT
jgi:hypothetical protein